MSDSFKAWTGVILVFMVAAGAFWLTNRPIKEPGDETGYESHVPTDAETAPKYVTDFYQALESGNAKAAKEAIAQHPELATQRFGDETALHVAARCNQAQLIDLLLQHHADPEDRGQWGGTALHWACWFGSKAAAERLSRCGESGHAPLGGRVPLCPRCGSGE